MEFMMYHNDCTQEDSKHQLSFQNKMSIRIKSNCRGFSRLDLTICAIQ